MAGVSLSLRCRKKKRRARLMWVTARASPAECFGLSIVSTESAFKLDIFFHTAPNRKNHHFEREREGQKRETYNTTNRSTCTNTQHHHSNTQTPPDNNVLPTTDKQTFFSQQFNNFTTITTRHHSNNSNNNLANDGLLEEFGISKKE